MSLRALFPGAALVHRWRAWGIVLIGCLLVLPSIGPYRVLDDYILALGACAEPRLAGLTQDRFDLFSFTTGVPALNRALIEQGVMLPWWSDEELRVVFFRPLASLLHRLDYWLWPEAAPPMYWHSLAWFAGVLLAVERLYRRLERSALAAGCAALLYACNDAHGAVVAWLSNRNALVAAAFGVLSILAHRRGQHAGSTWARVASPGCLLLSLCAGEFGLGTLAYLGAYALFIDQRAPGRRALALAPHALVLLLWLAAYRWSGAGVHGSDVYVHPLDDAAGFASVLPGRLLALLAGALGPLPSDLAFLDPGRARTWTVLSVALLALALYVLWPVLRSDRVARFWCAGLVLSVMPVAASFPSDRLLLFADVGSMALVARFASLLPSPQQRQSGVRAWLAAALLLSNVLVSPVVLPLRAAQMQLLGRAIEKATAMLDRVPELAQRTVVIVSAPADFFAAYIQAERAWKGLPRPRHLYWLTSAASEVRVSRVDANTLELERAGGFWATPLEQHYRRRLDHLRPGGRVVLPHMTAEVMGPESDEGPERVRFHFDAPLESDDFLFLAWNEDRFEPMPLDEASFPAADLAQIIGRTLAGSR